MIRAAFALVLTATSAGALADDIRIVERFYDAGQVVRIDGRTKVQATIQFGEDEHIENVAIGDSQAWQVTPNKRANLLFVKPLATTASTNMTVVTDRRTYLFDLVASASAKPLYVLRFTYPDEPQRSAPQLASGDEFAEPDIAAANPYAIVDPAKLNFAWRTKGDKKLLPQRVYDDGTATFITWADGQPMPAILVKDNKGLEGPVNFAARDDMIVIDGVPREIVLRSGNDSASLINSGPVRTAPVGPQAALARFTDKEGSR
ncbi:TrbG/VirB9 family P-type conjugative transfer protein [Parafrankia sp. BMG5.11]|uniref:TrbG/VirB9 family P-type conjugative transfer protein n=1 Tax=Parafrankia sp. BMG5.11 TaxID=222540 RepID=UPI00103F586E|nr:TrbG/VirB9 family P-type conjugative transfer protein [Parafrankia sp. BMG5.11]TCJ32494.1 type VI secretion protein [Parafrankia sp. BMG5.11]